MSDNLQKRAKLLWSEHRDVFKAADALIASASTSEFAKLAEMGAQQTIRSIITTQRKPDSTPDRILPHEAGEIARRSFLEEHMLFGGALSLAEATWKDAANSARSYWKQSDATKRMGDFHMAFAEVLKRTGKKGAEVFSDRTAKELMRKFRL